MIGIKVATVALAVLASASSISAACQGGVWPISDQQYWSYDGKVSPSGNGATMALVKDPSGGHGTKAQINSVQYLQYGKVTARVKPASGKGVITALVLFGQNAVADPSQPGTDPVHDEIDYEVVGSNSSTAQTNYFVRGHLDYGVNAITVQTPADSNGFVTYGIDWNADSLTWYVNGNAVRTLNREDTKDDSGNYLYPTDSSQLQLSVWDAGTGSAPGTVAWAGGATDWSVPEYDIQVDQIEVTCAGNSSDSSGSDVGAASSQNSEDQQSSDSSAATTSADASGSNPTSSDSAADTSSDSAANASYTSSAASPTDAASSASQPVEISTGGSATPTQASSTSAVASDDGESASSSSPFTVTSGSKTSSSAASNTATISDSKDPGQVGENVGSHLTGSATAIFASILAFVVMTMH